MCKLNFITAERERERERKKIMERKDNNDNKFVQEGKINNIILVT